ncbi:MAG: Sapep family Mn(2+)-dependent dipeptidase [Synergistaceae bacterium]|jgi:succinyl-diaminopimelate desuccinylase|nr:Sapep family Mn(2+)-dependent dipeptidase [Synergistaceae bacterium]
MKDEKVRRYVDENFDEMVSALSGLIRIPSVLDENARSGEHPFGPHVTEALGKFLSAASGLGFCTKNIDNMVGYAEAGEGPLIGILAHLDVMPPGAAANWKYPPFEAIVADGRLYGRGASDDKGPAVSALYAMKALMDAGVPLRKRFRLIAGLDEESGFRCIERYKKTEETPEMSFSPDAIFPVVNGEKGIIHFVLRRRISNPDAMGLPLLADIRGGDRFNIVPDELKVFFRKASAANLEAVLTPYGGTTENTGSGVLVIFKGQSAHAMEPWKGENAIQKFLAAVPCLDFGPPEVHMALIGLISLAGSGSDGKGFGIASSDEVSGPLSCSMAAISFDEGVLSVKFDVRYPVTSDGKTIEADIVSSAAEAGWEADIRRHSRPLFVPPESALVKTLLDAYGSVTGERGHPVCIGGGTYSKALPNAVSFGALFPGEEETAHQPNEYVDLESFRRMTLIYAEALCMLNDL